MGKFNNLVSQDGELVYLADFLTQPKALDCFARLQAELDWQQEVANGDTVAGYWDWVLSEAEATAVDLDSLCAAA